MNDIRALFDQNPFPSTGAAAGGLEITKILICMDEARSTEIRGTLIDKVLLKANKGSANPGDTRIFALIGNVGRGKTHLIQHMIQKASGEDVCTIGLDIPSLSNIYTIYTVPHSPTQQSATSSDKIFSWLLSRIINLDDNPRFKMGLVNSPSLPENKRIDLIEFANKLYQEKTGHSSIKSIAPLTFEEFYSILEPIITETLRISGKKGVFLVFDEMEGPIENLVQERGQFLTFIESLRELTDRITQSDLPLYIAFSFTIQPWYTLESNQSDASVQAFVDRLHSNRMILQASFSEDEIREFITQCLKLAVKDNTNYIKEIRKKNISPIEPFCEDSPQILRRYLKGEPRYVCQICNILFGEWFDKGKSITPDFMTDYLEKKISVNNELFRILCDRLGDLSYIIKIIKDKSRVLEFEQSELVKLIIANCKPFRIPCDEEKVLSDIEKITAENPEILDYNETKNRYLIGEDFQNIFGYVPERTEKDGFDPRLNVEHKLRECRNKIDQNPGIEKQLLTDGLIYLFTQMDRKPQALHGGVLAELPSNVSCLYIPVLNKVEVEDVEVAISLLKHNPDCISFVGKLPRTKAFSDDAIASLNSIQHPKSDEYFSEIQTLKGICREVGSQSDLENIESKFMNVNLSTVTSFLSIYEGRRIIQKIAAESQIWLMALPTFLDEVPQKNQEYASAFIENQIIPEIKALIQDKGISKITEIRKQGKINEYLPTDAQLDYVKQMELYAGSDGLYKGLPPIITNDQQTFGKKITSLQSIYLLTRNDTPPTLDYLRENNVVIWAILKYIQKYSPTKDKLRKISTDNSTTRRLNALIEILLKFGIIREESKKLKLGSQEISDYIDQTSEWIKDQKKILDEAHIKFTEDEEENIEALVTTSNDWIKQWKKGKESQPPQDLASNLAKTKDFLEETFKSAEKSAQQIIDDMAEKDMEEKYSSFSRAYSSIQETSSELYISEEQARSYLPQLIALDPSFADLMGKHADYLSYLSQAKELMEKKLFGDILDNREDYREVKKSLEIGIQKAIKRIASNIASFNSKTQALFTKIIKYLQNWRIPHKLNLVWTASPLQYEKFNKINFSEDFNAAISKRGEIQDNFKVVLGGIKNILENQIIECNKILTEQKETLKILVYNLKENRMLNVESAKRVERLIESVEKEIKFESELKLLSEIENDSGQPGLFEDIIDEKIVNYVKDYLLPSEDGELDYCGKKATRLREVQEEIDQLPLDSIEGATKEIYVQIKSEKGIDSSGWSKLESEYGKDLLDQIDKLIKFDLIKII